MIRLGGDIDDSGTRTTSSISRYMYEVSCVVVLVLLLYSSSAPLQRFPRYRTYSTNRCWPTQRGVPYINSPLHPDHEVFALRSVPYGSFPWTIMADFCGVDCVAGGISSLPRHWAPQWRSTNTASAERERVQGPGLPRLPRRECAACCARGIIATTVLCSAQGKLSTAVVIPQNSGMSTLQCYCCSENIHVLHILIAA